MRSRFINVCVSKGPLFIFFFLLVCSTKAYCLFHIYSGIHCTNVIHFFFSFFLLAII
jgi:hypothetical protein